MFCESPSETNTGAEEEEEEETFPLRWSVYVCDSSTGTCNMQQSGRRNRHFSERADRGRNKKAEKSLQAEQLKAAGVVFPVPLFLSACLSLPPLPARSPVLQSYTHRSTLTITASSTHTHT